MHQHLHRLFGRSYSVYTSVALSTRKAWYALLASSGQNHILFAGRTPSSNEKARDTGSDTVGGVIRVESQ